MNEKNNFKNIFVYECFDFMVACAPHMYLMTDHLEEGNGFPGA